MESRVRGQGSLGTGVNLSSRLTQGQGSLRAGLSASASDPGQGLLWAKRLSLQTQDRVFYGGLSLFSGLHS